MTTCAGVRQQHRDGDGRLAGVGQLGEVVHDRHVEVESTLVNLLQRRDRGVDLGERGEAEDGVWARRDALRGSPHSRRGGRPFDLRSGAVEPAELGQQIPAYSGQQVLRPERGLRGQRVDQFEADGRPNAVPSATARLSSATGDSATRASAS
jgi:hypothetical protein